MEINELRCQVSLNFVFLEQQVILDSAQDPNGVKDESRHEQKETSEDNGVNLDGAILIEVNKTEKPGSHSSRSSSQRTRKQGHPSRLSRG